LPEDDEGQTFVAASPATLQVRELAAKVAVTNAPVLIVGESGVGKEALARFLHRASGAPEQSFVRVHCSSAQQDALDAELFGSVERGPGKMELAEGGTLLLDDVGELGPALQAKLLRVLEDGAWVPKGGSEPLRLRARIVSTSDLQLERAVTRGDFRQDLYWRLRVIRLGLPPLRERRADIPKLCEHFISRFAQRGHSVPRIPDRVMEAFVRHDWPGNARELAHVIEQYGLFPNAEFVLAQLDTQPLGSNIAPPTITASSPAPTPAVQSHGGRLPAYVAEAEAEAALAVPAELEDGKICLKVIAARAAEEAEKRVVLRVLEQYHWNRKRAAARMDICYKTLLNKLERWELHT
jgi:DNA-binding NtrC family response regulator